MYILWIKIFRLSANKKTWRVCQSEHIRGMALCVESAIETYKHNYSKS